MHWGPDGPDKGEGRREKGELRAAPPSERVTLGLHGIGRALPGRRLQYCDFVVVL